MISRSVRQTNTGREVPTRSRRALRWPFLAPVDERGQDLGFVCLLGPVRTRQEAAALERLRESHRLVGLTSFLTFPAHREPGDTRDYGALCEAWCHCFREPDRYLPAGVPRLLLSHSDFTDWVHVSPERVCPEDDGSRDFDFAYVCQEGAWTEAVKDWPLARRCLPVLCGELGLEGVLVGRERVEDVPKDCRAHVTVRGRLPWPELMRVLRRSRFLFVPGARDASPRLIAEALAMDTPVVVHRDILGGWHYVNPFTGSFFGDAHDVAEAARTCLERGLRPRRWFMAHHGPHHAGARLYALLRQLEPRLRPVRQLYLAPWLTGPSRGATEARAP